MLSVGLCSCEKLGLSHWKECRLREFKKKRCEEGV